MKTSLHLFLLVFCLPFMIISCGPDEGCTSSFATNYDKSATEECCCTYDVERIVDELLGSYSYDSDYCKSLEDVQNIIIKEDPNVENGVIMTNLYVYDDIEVPGVFINGDFKFEYFDLDAVHCKLRTTATLKSNSLGLSLNLKHTGTNAIGNLTSLCYLSGFSCEGILTKI